MLTDATRPYEINISMIRYTLFVGFNLRVTPQMHAFARQVKLVHPTG